MDEVGVDQASRVDREDGGEGDGVGAIWRAVEGHGVDFVGHEVDVVFLAEAHV